MSSPSNATSTKLWKTPKFWLILLFVGYSAFGWLAVPFLVKQQTIKSLKEIAGWETRIESVFFNPYALSLAIHGFAAQDKFQQDTLSFDRLFVNFDASRSILGSVSFDEISLTNPVIHGHVDKNGQLNFARDFVKTNDSETNEEPSAGEEDSQPIEFAFGLISISNGKFGFTDNRTSEVFELTLEPVNLALHDFSTSQNDGGNYTLELSVGNDQELTWNGQIGIAPFSSSGTLSLNNIRSSSFWHYLKPFSPYELRNALISLETTYTTEFSDTVSRFNIESGSLSLEQIGLAESLAEDSFLNIQSINLGSMAFDLEARRAELGIVEVEAPELRAIKYDDSRINLLPPPDSNNSVADNSTAKTETNTAKDEDNESAPFTWSVAGLALKQGTVNWQDRSLEESANLSLSEVNLTLGKITHQLEKPFNYQLSFRTGETTQSLEGDLSLAPFEVGGHMNLAGLPLNWLQPYINQQLSLVLEAGQLNLNSDYQVALADSGIEAAIKANTQINQLIIKDGKQQDALAGFNNFAISGIDLKMSGSQSPTVFIDEIKLSQPYARAQMDSNGKLNLAQVSKASKKVEAVKKEEESKLALADSSEQSGPANIEINRVILEGGKFSYSDSSVKPVFNTELSELTGTIRNITSAPDVQSNVEFTGNLDTVGRLAINGTVNPFGTKPNSSLNITVNNIDLSNASPYSAKYAGYLIDKGKLDLDLVYNVEGSILKAKNHVFIDKFKFGDSTDSPDATSLPLPLAVGIMKNLKGEINIDLPISGDLSDPSFSITNVVFTAFTNLISKIVTSPFSILGSLVKGSDDISTVHFKAMENQPSQKEITQILKLAEALKKRPSLILELRGQANSELDRSSDGQALSEEALQALAKQRALNISKILTEQGSIPEQRIYRLEPKLIKDANALLVPSMFTIKVN